MLNDLRALPGVESAACTSFLPMVMRGGIWPVVMNGKETVRSAACQVRRMILREGILLALGGVVPGALLAYAAGRGMEALLAGVTPSDVPTFGVATALCAVTTVLGCLRPAIRASKVDPMSAIRSE